MSSSCTSIYVLNLPPAFLLLFLLLFMLSASSLSALSEDPGWLLWLMAVRREGKRRDGEGRWAGAAAKWRGAVCPLAQISDLGFSDIHTAAAAKWMRERNGEVEWKSARKKKTNRHKTRVVAKIIIAIAGTAIVGGGGEGWRCFS